MSEVFSEMRWDPYILIRDSEFSQFWGTHLKPGGRDILFVLGRGYDPRALDATRSILTQGGTGEVWFLAFDNGLEDSARRSELTQINTDALYGLFPEGAISNLDVVIDTSTQANTTARNTTRALQNAGDLSQYTVSVRRACSDAS